MEYAITLNELENINKNPNKKQTQKIRPSVQLSVSDIDKIINIKSINHCKANAKSDIKKTNMGYKIVKHLFNPNNESSKSITKLDYLNIKSTITNTSHKEIVFNYTQSIANEHK